MGSDYLSSNGELLEEKGNQNIYVSDSFVVDVERFSHLVHKNDTNGNSTITLQRNVSRKGYSKGGNKNIKLTTSNKSNDNALPGSSPEKPSSPLLHHHQIVVKNSTPASENKQFGARIHSPSTWTLSIDPRRILIFFATLSSLGTILLIYFTLSIRNQLINDPNS